MPLRISLSVDLLTPAILLIYRDGSSRGRGGKGGIFVEGQEESC